MSQAHHVPFKIVPDKDAFSYASDMEQPLEGIRNFALALDRIAQTLADGNGAAIVQELALTIQAGGTGLGLQTVRTIIGREDRSDRTSAKRVRKYMPDRAAEITNKWRKRDFDDLPKRVGKLAEKGAALITEAKRLGKR
jgi:hypothetical protein